MLKSILRITLTLFAGLAFNYLLAEEGIVIKSETQLKSGKTESTTIYIGDVMVKMGGGSADVIFDSSRESFTVIDHEKKEVLLITRQDMDMLKSQVNQMMKMMEEQLKNLPPEQQEMVKKNMGGNMSSSEEIPDYDFKLVKRGVQVGEWDSDHYESFLEGEKKGDLYIADYSQLGVSKSDFGSMKKLGDFIQDLTEGFSSFKMESTEGGFLGFKGEGNPIFTVGVPIKVVEYEEGARGNVMTIKEIKKEDLSSSIFKAPSGYKQQTLQDMMQGMGGR